MRDLSLRRSEIMDPPGKKYWPLYKGRDGCRSPMQWDDSPGAGFTSGTPWLKVHPDASRRNVAAQDQDPDSLLNFTRRLIALRRATPALVRGNFAPLSAPPGVLAYLRHSEDQTALVVMNFSDRRKAFSAPPGNWEVLLTTGGQETVASLTPRAVLVAIHR
jgi:alpha-glucosidase